MWLPDGEHDATAGPRQLVGDLDAGRGGADDEHAARLQLAGVAVAQRRQQVDVRVQLVGGAPGTCGRPVGPVATTTLRASQLAESATTR